MVSMPVGVRDDPDYCSKWDIEGAIPLRKIFFPFSFQGEGDKGDEVDKYLSLPVKLRLE